MFFDDVADDNRVFQVTSQIDYYENLNLMKESIQKWSSVHSFLNAKVIKIDSEHYFVKAHHSTEIDQLKMVNNFRLKI